MSSRWVSVYSVPSTARRFYQAAFLFRLPPSGKPRWLCCDFLTETPLL